MHALRQRKRLEAFSFSSFQLMEMIAMITASPPPTPPSSLPLGPRKPSAQTELFPLHVIFALNLGAESLGSLGRESLEDAGRESQHAVQFCLKKLWDDFALYLIFDF